MENITLNLNKGKTIHFINAKYSVKDNNIIVREYDIDEMMGGYSLVGTHIYEKTTVKDIKYDNNEG